MKKFLTVWFLLVLGAVLGAQTNIVNTTLIRFLGTDLVIRTGSASPEGSVTAPAGSTYMRTNGVTYVKASGSGNTGWSAFTTGTGAPADAQYWTGAADGTLSAEKNLGALSTGLVINTSGVPSAYAGSSCSASNFVSSISASGVATCSVPSGTGAPTDATYITQTANGTLSNEQAIGALSSGILRGATTTGVITSLGDVLPCANGGTSLSTGTSGGVLAFTGSCTIVSSGALTANLPVIGGGAGSAPTVGTRSGNTTQFVTTTGTLTSGDCVKIDASGNFIANGSACGGGGGSSALSGITAATTSNTIANGNNSGQVWNWANTTAATTAFTFGETTAATNGGTSDGQVLLGINTLSTSTATALYIKNYGASNSLRIDDVSGDTSPFEINAGGQVIVGGLSANIFSATVMIDVQGASNGSYSQVWYDGTDRIGIFSDTNKAGIGTQTNHNFELFANNSNARLQVIAAGTMDIWRRQTPASSIGTGTTGYTNAYLHIGGDEFATNGYFNIAFGWSSGTTVSPAYIGFQMISSSGDTYGDLVFGTRSVTSDTAPTERMRIVNDGGILIASLTSTGSATGKKMVCVDTSTGKLYASSTDTSCLN